jgi:protein phosphatase
LGLEYAAALSASKGGRRYQEDHGLVAPTGSAFLAGQGLDIAEPSAGLTAVLCDGMGGHVGGATASRMVAASFFDALATADLADVSAALGEAVRTANLAIARHIQENTAFTGMGTTLVGVVVDASGLHWVSVGDSLLYLWRRGEVARINADHSLAPELDRLAAAGRISVEQARNDPRRHYLRSAISGEEIELIDLAGKPLQLAAGDVVILASDGLQTLTEPEIERILAREHGAAPVVLAAALVEAVDAVGVPNQDNTTVIALTVCDQATC